MSSEGKGLSGTHRVSCSLSMADLQCNSLPVEQGTSVARAVPPSRKDFGILQLSTKYPVGETRPGFYNGMSPMFHSSLPFRDSFRTWSLVPPLGERDGQSRLPSYQV